VFSNITTDCANVFPLIFSELNASSIDNVEVAANCAVELLSLSLNDESFVQIKSIIAGNVDSLLASASVAINKNDVECAEQLSRVFSQLALAHSSQIIATGQTQILEILVKLLTDVPELSCRSQIAFWKDLFRKLQKCGEEKQKYLTQFEQTLLQLLESLCRKATMPDYSFQELNETSMREEPFDEICKLRKDIGSLIRALSKCCGTLPVLNLLDTRIAKSFTLLQQASGD
jgi:hypothetical protein